MIRTVPYGISPGQVVEPLINSEMTNGKNAIAGVKYSIRVVYPGGVIIKAEDEDMHPGGLLKAGTPVHVLGEPDPTEEELAILVEARILPTSAILSHDVSDAADYAGTGVWDYRIVPGRRVRTPRQASVLCDILVETGKTEFTEFEVFQLVTKEGTRLNTKQDPKNIFKYYRSNLSSEGFLITRKG